MNVKLNLSTSLSSPDFPAEQAREYLHETLALFSACRMGIWSYDLNAKTMTFLNDYFEVLGLERIGVHYSTLDEARRFIHPEDWAEFEVTLTSATSVGTSRFRCVGKGGETVRMRSSYFRLPGKEGQPEKVFAYTTNDTLREQHDTLYRRLINSMPDFIFVFDINFTLVDLILPEGMRLFHTREELIGSSGRMLYSDEVSDLLTNNIREVLRTGTIREVEYHLDLFDKRYYWQARLVPIDEKVYAVIRDIGDRVRRMDELLAARKRAEESDRMKSAFIANMSHEIRTPLNAIVGFTEMVAEETDPAVRAEYLKIIHANNELLLQLINDILDLSRIESGKSEMAFEPADMRLLVHEAEAIHRMKLPSGVKLLVEEPAEDIVAHTDRMRVMQVLSNLLSNAIKNTVAGSITLRLDAHESDLRFSVRDTGRGIPAERLETIFNRFEKANEFLQGTGLGLAISRSLVEHLGGEIGVESTVGEGSTFWFTIPYRDTLSAHEGRPIGDTREMLFRKKVLVAEPSDFDFETARKVLRKTYDVIRAGNGSEAVGAFITEKPDLIVMNIQMPEMNGIEATKKIRSMSAHVPIIAVTANDFYMEQRWALESGASEVISKPYSSLKLEEAVLAFDPDR